MSEVVGHADAFAEGAREQEARLRNRLPAAFSVPLVGGPLDGMSYAVPVDLVRGTRRPFDVPVPLAEPSKLVHVESRRSFHAVYRFDRASMVLRYLETTSYS